MEISQEQIDRLKEILEFYAEGSNYEWEGCRCHGHYVQCEHGEKADEAIGILMSINECPKCGWDLLEDSCSNMDCEDYDWSDDEFNEP